MSCHGNNATAPSPAIGPGAELIDTAAAARTARIDPRIQSVVPSFDAPFFQAGLAGYSDAAMRIIARRLGCPYCVTEALLDRTLLAGGRGFAKADLGELHDNIPGGAEDHPLAGQIMGSDPDEMAAAAIKMIEQAARPPAAYRALAEHPQPRHSTNGCATGGSSTSAIAQPPHFSTGSTDDSEPWNSCRAPAATPLRHPATSPLSHPSSQASNPSSLQASSDIPPPPPSSLRPSVASSLPLSFSSLDINLACPVKKISRKARGGHWLCEPVGAIDILRAVRDAVGAQIPLTLKIRRGSDDSAQAERDFERIFTAAYELGYAWATVHGRTVEQKYVGPSRWTFLRDLVKRHPDKIIFGSGDVWDVHDIFRMLAYTGVHAVSVARGCIGNPWIFRQARQMMAGDPPAPPTIDEQRSVLEEHFAISVAINGERRAGLMMRKFGVRFATHHPDSETVRRRFIAASNTHDWRQVLDDHYTTAFAGATASAVGRD